MPRIRIPRGRLALGALALAAAAAAGAVAVSLVPLRLPASLQKAPAPSEISIASHDFDDERPVEITVSRGSSSPATAAAPGLLTAYTCAVGAEVESGSSFFALDGAPVLALATEVPLWRDLAIGDTGADVRALQAELSRLGHTAAIDGSLGRATLRAAKEALAAVGITWAGSTFPVSQTVWLPAPKATVRTCDSVLGKRVETGDPVATFSSGHPSISVVDLPRDLVPGARVVTVGGSTIPVDATGRSAPVAVDLDAVTPDAGTGDSAPPKPTAATLALAEPTRVSSVPPSSIIALDGSSGCVESGGDLFHVRVVGSQLGQTFVQFEQGAPPNRIRLHPARRSCP